MGISDMADFGAASPRFFSTQPGTPGKLIIGLRILRVDGSPVGYREATLRYLPDLILAILMSLGVALAALGMADDEHFSRSWFDLQDQLERTAPGWKRWINIANQVWTRSEVIVLLTNRKRRAIHDFIAGTIVVVIGSKPKAAAVVPTPSAP